VSVGADVSPGDEVSEGVPVGVGGDGVADGTPVAELDLGPVPDGRPVEEDPGWAEPSTTLMSIRKSKLGTVDIQSGDSVICA